MTDARDRHITQPLSVVPAVDAGRRVDHERSIGDVVRPERAHVDVTAARRVDTPPQRQVRRRPSCRRHRRCRVRRRRTPTCSASSKTRTITSSVTTPFEPVTESCSVTVLTSSGASNDGAGAGERADATGDVGPRRLGPHDGRVGRVSGQVERRECRPSHRRRPPDRRPRWRPRSMASSSSFQATVVDVVVELGLVERWSSSSRSRRLRRRRRLGRRNTPMPASNTTTAAMLAPMVMPRRLDSFMAGADVRAGSRAM